MTTLQSSLMTTTRVLRSRYVQSVADRNGDGPIFFMYLSDQETDVADTFNSGAAFLSAPGDNDQEIVPIGLVDDWEQVGVLPADGLTLHEIRACASFEGTDTSYYIEEAVALLKLYATQNDRGSPSHCWDSNRLTRLSLYDRHIVDYVTYNYTWEHAREQKVWAFTNSLILARVSLAVRTAIFKR